MPCPRLGTGIRLWGACREWGWSEYLRDLGKRGRVQCWALGWLGAGAHGEGEAETQAWLAGRREGKGDIALPQLPNGRRRWSQTFQRCQEQDQWARAVAGETPVRCKGKFVPVGVVQPCGRDQRNGYLCPWRYAGVSWTRP